MSFAGSGYIAILKRKQAEQEKDKREKERKRISKDQRKFLKKFGLIQ